MYSRDHGAVLVLAGIALAMLLSTTCAAGFPERPLRLIVPFPPGGAADVMARIVATKLGENLQQPVLIDNRPGAGTVMGTELFVKSSPDGYTLFLHTPPTAINVTLLKKVPYDTRRDIVPVVTLGRTPLIVLVNPATQANSIKDLVAAARRKPDGLTYASSGNGGSPHLATELLRQLSGMPLVHVPYQGAPPAATAVLGGQVDFTITSVIPRAQIDAGKVRAIAVTGAKRWFLMPDTPTVAEQGFPKYEASTWQGLSVPRGTPRSVIDVISREALKALRSPDVVSRINAQGFEVIGDTPEQAAQFLAAEIEKWGGVVRFSGAQPE